MAPLKNRRALPLSAILLALFSLVCGTAARAQQASPVPPPAAVDPKSTAEFTAAADEVLGQMSEITGLKLVSPVKKTLRSREEIRAYVIHQMNEEKDPGERYAAARSAEAFGLLPKGFDFDNFMIELLTEQIAGLYDPKAHEFYIADWIPLSDQRMVMAHELTHALEDQHFKIEDWVKAARPNDDAELARESVLEGSAMAAMVDFLLQGSGRSLKDLPDIDPAMLVGDMSSTPTLQKAPPFLKDALIFPYLSGMTFTAEVLKPAGWPSLPAIFNKPPASTQQILHPALYRSGKVPAPVKLPAVDKLVGPGWTKLEENLMGEFGWKEILKQYLDESRAKALAAAWDGDRYVVFEQKQSKQLLLVARLDLAGVEQTLHFFGQYSEALEKKHAQRTNLFRRADFFSFETPDGGVFLRCVATECITVEGASRALFDSINKSIGWPAAPEPPIDPAKVPDKTASIVPGNRGVSTAPNGARAVAAAISKNDPAARFLSASSSFSPTILDASQTRWTALEDSDRAGTLVGKHACPPQAGCATYCPGALPPVNFCRSREEAWFVHRNFAG
jgi:hypothetical protein